MTKPKYISQVLINHVKKAKKEGKKTLKTRSRASTIIPQMIGLIVMVYNGKIYIPVSISAEMVGFKLGEFSPTRTYRGHAAGKKDKGGK